jgi:hypothetical protein
MNFKRPVIDDVSRAACDEFDMLGLGAGLSGMKVGITAGSRGIRDIAQILRALVGKVRSCGGEPFVLAAMGSHGGGIPSGQIEILKELGLTEKSLGAPIVPCAESVELGTTVSGHEVCVLRSAISADAIIAVNRIKAHTAFHGDAESGLLKMLTVGLGGPGGAARFHSAGSEKLAGMLIETSRLILEKLPVIAGFAIVENGYEETALVKGVLPCEMLDEEISLLRFAKSLMPKLPVSNLDALIVEEMGKNYSGTGMDTNIIGRLRIEGMPEPDSPAIKRIAVLGLSEESHGNANGVGLADIVTKKLVDAIDRKATFLNCVTTGFLIRGATPVYFDTEREVVSAMLGSLGGSSAVRLVQIPNTLHISECFVSEALEDELRETPDARIMGDPFPMEFTEGGDLMFRCGNMRNSGKR